MAASGVQGEAEDHGPSHRPRRTAETTTAGRLPERGARELPELERKRKELGERSESLLAQKRQLEASTNERMELAKIADSIERFCEQVRSGLANATFEHRRALVELLIDQVVVTNEEVEIRYVVPTSPEGPHHPFCHLRTDYLPLLQKVA